MLPSLGRRLALLWSILPLATGAGIVVVSQGVIPAEALAAPSPQAQGVALMKQGDYAGALEQFKVAAASKPNDAFTQMWLGIAQAATGDRWTAQDTWRGGIGSKRWEPVAFYLKGLGFWHEGDESSAAYYFKQSLNVASTFQPARLGLQQVEAGASVPAPTQWASLAGLPASPPTVTVATAKPTTGAKPVAASKTKAPAKATSQSQPVSARGANPKAGRWEAVVHNGYKGDKLTFRVSPDGKRIQNVEFVGHWRNSGSISGLRTEVLKNLDPPAPFAVKSGAFAGTQNVAKSRMWWEFTGRFTTATTAEGTYRAAYAGGEYDTYKLKWTARRVGS